MFKVCLKWIFLPFWLLSYYFGLLLLSSALLSLFHYTNLFLYWLIILVNTFKYFLISLWAYTLDVRLCRKVWRWISYSNVRSLSYEHHWRFILLRVLFLNFIFRVLYECTFLNRWFTGIRSRTLHHHIF